MNFKVLVVLVIILLAVFLPSKSHAQYFYYWAEDYSTVVSKDGRAFLNTRLKTSDYSKFDFTVDGKSIAKNIEVLQDEVVDFPLYLSEKYTKDRSFITICSLKQTTGVDFQQEVCLNVKLIK